MPKLIEEYIGVGKASAVTRETLCRLTGMDDRQVREAIEAARHAGVMICNGGNGKGYYQAETVEDVQEQYRREMGRAKAILHCCKPLRKYLKEKGAL